MTFPISITVVCLLFSKVTHGIIGGKPAPDYPFFAVVRRGDQMCGGTLIRLDAVLTAAHCLYFDTENRWASPIEVYVLHGDVSTPNNWTLRYHSCENFFVNSNYNTSTHGARSSFDYAVIKLEDKVNMRFSLQPTILPLCRFNKHKWHKNKNGIAIGLGFTSLYPPLHAERLMQTSIRKVDCRHPDFENQQIPHPVQVCYSIAPGSSMTDSDFGSPMVAIQDGIAYCLIGASSCTIYSSKKGYFANVFTAGGRLRMWLHRVFSDSFTYEDFRTNEW